jgi:GTP-binding protein
LSYYRHRRLFRAERAGNGRGKKMYGKNGEDLILPVPEGTLVFAIDEDGSHKLLADLKEPEEQVRVVRGGHGGRGNIHFASPTNQAPQEAEEGKPGQEAILVLDVRLIADAGVLGEPNAGKSTLLAAATAAKPKIADYPFTTIEPVLGIVDMGLKTFVLAEIPGLIEGAHAGRGLGFDFLRHAMRTRVVIHLVDGSAENPVQVMDRLNNELVLFDPVLGAKPQLTVVNKIDLPDVRERIGAIRQMFRDAGREVFFISAATKEGVEALMAATLKLIESLPEEKKEEKAAETPIKVFRPKQRDVRNKSAPLNR